MAISSVNVGRVTSTLKTDSLLAALRSNTNTVYREQNRISIGRQFLVASDDPGRAARALDLSQIMEKQSQLLTNIRHASNTLDATDVAMAEVSALIIDAQAIASQNIGTLASADERTAAAEIIASIREQLVVVGNRTYEGRYLFAGRDTDEQPFIGAMGGVAYVGDTGDIYSRTDVNELEPINLPGNIMFGALSSEVTGFADLSPQLIADIRLEDLTGATNQGLRLGTLQIAEDGGATYNIDLTKADTIGDVVDTINAAATAGGAAFTASLNADGITITPGGPAITVRDISTGTTASDLGVVTTTPTAAAIVGADLGAKLTRTTSVADLAGGTGVNLADGIVITNGSDTATIDLSGAETVQDILNSINNCGLYVKAEINDSGTGINVLNMVSGLSMNIGENGGTTATELGIRSLITTTSLDGLNDGIGVRTEPGMDDIRINAKDGTSFAVNLDGVSTIGDVIDAINDAATAAGISVTAGLADVGNGIQLADATGGAGSFWVSRENLSYAVDDLGLAERIADPGTVLVADEVNPARAEGILTRLIDLENALRDNDSQALTIASEELDVLVSDFNRSRGVIGARGAAMQDRLLQTDNAVFATESLLSEVQDLDFTEAITKFQQAQTALQASLMTGAQILNTSLLNFLQ